VKNAIVLAVVLSIGLLCTAQPSAEVQFIITSDSHYGIARPAFRGETNVDAHIVNQALVAQINRITSALIPSDGGLHANRPVGSIDFLVDTGDIANREEKSEGGNIQTAAASWAQFRTDYLDGLTLLDPLGRRAPVYVVPGNHDASNAVGYYKLLAPLTDKTSMAEIYNLMMSPSQAKTATTFDYTRDKIRVSHDVAGIHFIFLTLWPDTDTRTWMEKDLVRVGPNTPVILFAHDPPDSDSKHFSNPNGKHDVNAIDKFENLLSDVFADTDGKSKSSDLPPSLELNAWEDFLRQHPNVTAYFHGHNNWNQFYDWTGPNHTVTLHTFRVDSPMKGHVSATDETKLSFQIATIDVASRTMTVREVLWNADPQHADAPIRWGASTTVALAPRPAR